MNPQRPHHPRRLGAGSAAACTAAVLIGLTASQRLAAAPACDGPARASSLSSTRFVDNGDGTITDQESKLMWMRCSAGQQWQRDRCVGAAGSYTWVQARSDAERINREGVAFFNDWRLPVLRELATITDRGCEMPRTNLVAFPGTVSAPYWTATPRTGERSPERLWTLSFGTEGLRLATQDERFHVRLVRTGP